MKLHANAATCPKSRWKIVCRALNGEARESIAADHEISERTVAKWVARYRAEGEAGLVDRSSAPGSIPHRTAEDRVQTIAALRRLRLTGAQIAMCLGMPPSTVSAVLQRIGLGRLSRLEPLEPPNRYERARPGELIHIDVKKLGAINGAGHRVNGRRASQNVTRRGRRQGKAPGWEFVHVCVDDATRLAYVEVLKDEQGRTAAGFLRRAVRLLRLLWDHRAARDERQRRLLPIHDPRRCLPAARAQTPAHPALPAAHERKGGALHPHHAGRLGLRRDLRHQQRTHRRP
jgi:transposase